MNKKTIATIIILIALIASIYIGYNYRGENTNQTNQNTYTNLTATMPLGPGSTLEFNSTLYFLDSNQSVSTNITVRIDEYTQWPLVNITLVGQNTTQASMLPYANLMLPRESLGKQTLNLPLAILMAQEGACAKLVLESSNNTAYVYGGEIKIGPYNITIEHTYDSKGLLEEAKYQLYASFPDKNQTLNLLQVIRITNITVKNESYQVTYNSSWMCQPPISSDLLFTWDTIIHLSKENATIVSLNDLRNAMDDGAYVVFVLKSCPHCQKTWPHILEAVNQTGTNIYVVVMGNLMDPDYQHYIQFAMQSNGLTGYPSITYFRGGFVVDKITGEVTTEQLVAFFSSNH